jgi:hypothetical protein
MQKAEPDLPTEGRRTLPLAPDSGWAISVAGLTHAAVNVAQHN